MEILFEETSALWFSPDNAVSYCAGTASETVRIPDSESQSAKITIRGQPFLASTIPRR